MGAWVTAFDFMRLNPKKRFAFVMSKFHEKEVRVKKIIPEEPMTLVNKIDASQPSP